MSRPQKYSDEKILTMAAKVFLEHGPQASTAQIAKEAGVSEGILFKRFKTKQALFEAALTLDTEPNQWRETLLASVGKGSPKENLQTAILALLTKLQKIIPKFMVLEGRGLKRPLMKAKAKAPPLEDAATFTAYLKQEAKLGRVQGDRFELHGHEIVGAVVHNAMMKIRHKKDFCAPEELAEHLADIHLADSRKAKPGAAKKGNR